MNDEEEFVPETPMRKTNSKKQSKKKTFGQELLSTFLTVIIFTGILLLIQRYLIAPVDVEGNSMEPTLSDSDRLILTKIGDIERFDVVVFPAPDDPEKQYIKRVIGLPGDEISYRENTLFINGQEVNEPYIELPDEETDANQLLAGNFSLETLYGHEEVPEGEYFLLGDNRINSRDSRTFGFVEGEDIVGKTSLRIWPWSERGFINGDLEESTNIE